MEEIPVLTAGGEYRVYVGNLLYEGILVDILGEREPVKLVVVSQPAVMELYARRLLEALGSLAPAGKEPIVFTFPEGEEHKNLETLEEGYSFLLQREVNREDIILAFGGGVVGDLAGFLASSFLRGIRYIQLPTTLMAMVDSAIGGKVGVDLPGAKNAVGAFYQPGAVICDIDVLRTLPARELKSGLAEVAKYGFLYDQGLLKEMESWKNGLPQRETDLSGIVARCVGHKARVVSVDERDVSGERAMLNYGHTFGHALESSTGYRLLRHGEAVAVGMIMAARAAELAGLADTDLAFEHKKVLMPLVEGLKVPDEFDPEKALKDMRADKKRGKEVRFILLEGPQKPRLVDSLPESVVREAMEEILEDLRRAD